MIIAKSVSVIISTYAKNRLHHVLNCVKSLKVQTLSPQEIILVLDRNETLAEFYKSHMPNDVIVVVSEGYGLSKARNAGAQNANGEIVAFIDDDAVAGKDWLKNLIENYNDPQVVCVGGLIMPVWESNRPKWFPEELDWIVGCSYKGLPQKKAIVRNPIGCNMSFRKTVFQKVGYFREDIGRVGNTLMAHEDTEFAIRIRKKISDAKILYDPASIVYHRVPNSRANLKYIARRSFSEGFSKAFFSRFRSNPANVLHIEQDYLKNLFSIAIPKRLLKSYRSENMSQILTLLFSTLLVLIGYILGEKSL